MSEVLAEARRLPREKRAAYLDESGLSAEGRAEVESLLAAADTMGGFLERPAAAALDAPHEYEPGDRVAGYEIERLLDRGGSGVVYVAMQDQPRRRVALKVMRGGAFTEASLERFRAEAEILGRLRHPHVAHVYEAGVHEGRPFLALEFVEGARTLLEYATERRLDPRVRLALFASICDAVHHGHQKGVIHRDVKPGNVLVEPGGRPKLIDYGIARAGDGPSRELVGTPPYMSPEQCDPDGDVDSRADVYALGVVCQELLTGVAPHRVTGVSAVEAMRRLREESPTTAGSVDRSLRGDVDAILRKATERDRDDRYASASALAADVRRHLRAFPVEARDGGLLYQLACFARRQSVAFAAACLLAVVLVAAAVTNRSLAIERESERKEAERQASLANLAAATAALRVHDVSEAKQRLDAVPEAFRNWEWDHLQARTDQSVRRFVTPGYNLRRAVVSPDGRYSASIIQGARGLEEEYSAVEIIDLQEGTQRIFLTGDFSDRRDCLAFHPTEPVVAIGHASGKVRTYALADATPLAEIDAHTNIVIDLVYAPDGTLITGSRDTSAKIWNADGTLRHVLDAPEDRVICLEVSTGGDLVAAGDRAGVIRIWNLASGELVHTLRGHERSVEGVAFSPDDERLASVSRDQSVRLWNVRDESTIAVRRAHLGNVRDVVFLPHGPFISASWDGTLRAWDGRAARALGTLAGHDDQVTAVGISRSLARIVSCSRDGSTRLWRWNRFEAVPTLRGHRDRVMRVAFRGDSRRVATASNDGTVCVWDVETGERLAALKGMKRIEYLEWRDDETLVAAANYTLRTWTKRGEQWVQESRKIPPLCAPGAAHFDPKTGRLYLASWKRVEILDKDLGRVRAIPVGDGGVMSLVVLPSGRIVCSDSKQRLLILDAETGAVLRTRELDYWVYEIIKAGSEILATIGPDIHVLDPETLATKRVLKAHAGVVYCLAVSPDGTRLASGGTDRALRLWDLRTGTPVAVLRGHRFEIRDIQFSPDGATIASGDGSSEDALSAAKLWKRHRVPRAR